MNARRIRYALIAILSALTITFSTPAMAASAKAGGPDQLRRGLADTLANGIAAQFPDRVKRS